MGAHTNHFREVDGSACCSMWACRRAVFKACLGSELEHSIWAQDLPRKWGKGGSRRCRTFADSLPSKGVPSTLTKQSPTSRLWSVVDVDDTIPTERDDNHAPPPTLTSSSLPEGMVRYTGGGQCPRGAMAQGMLLCSSGLLSHLQPVPSTAPTDPRASSTVLSSSGMGIRSSHTLSFLPASSNTKGHTIRIASPADPHVRLMLCFAD